MIDNLNCWMVFSAAAGLGLLVAVWLQAKAMRQRLDELTAYTLDAHKLLKAQEASIEALRAELRDRPQPQQPQPQSQPGPAPALASPDTAAPLRDTPDRPAVAPAARADAQALHSADEAHSTLAQQPAGATSAPRVAAEAATAQATTAQATTAQAATAQATPPDKPRAPATKPAKSPAKPPAPDARPDAARPASGSIERGLGGTVAVWAGAGALALSGALLVQYSVESGILGPTARIALGVGAGLAMLAGGRFALRRVELVGGGLMAAGVAVIYAALAAASLLYDLLGPLSGGALMVLTTAGAATLAIRHKIKIIAVLGLLGGFLTPVLTGTQNAAAVPLLGYLFLLNLGVIAVAWKRGWPFLTYMAFVLTFIAELGWMSQSTDGAVVPYLLMVVLLAGPFAAASYWGFGVGATPRDPLSDGLAGLTSPSRGADGWDRLAAWIGLQASLVLPLLIGLIAGVRWSHTPYLWAQQGLLNAIAFVIAGLDKRYRLLPWVAASLVFLQQLIHVAVDAPSPAQAMSLHSAFGALAILGFSALTLRKPDQLAPPISAAVAGLSYLTLALAGPASRSLQHWGLASLALCAWMAALGALARWRWRRAAAPDDAPPASLSALAVAAIGFLTATFFLELGGAPLAVALTLSATATVALGALLRDGPVRVAGHLLGVIAACALLPTEAWLDALRASPPVFNGILVRYGGAAAASFACAVVLLRAHAHPKPGRPSAPSLLSARVYAFAGLGLALVWITATVHHAFRPDGAGSPTQTEQLTYSLCWAAVGIATLVVGLLRGSALSRVVSLALIIGTTLKVFLFDLSNLQGLWRVGSVAALGAVLIGIATLYRLYIFPPPPADDDAADDAADDGAPTPPDDGADDTASPAPQAEAVEAPEPAPDAPPQDAAPSPPDEAPDDDEAPPPQ